MPPAVQALDTRMRIPGGPLLAQQVWPGIPIFPMTAILDSGAGSDSNPIGGNWTTSIWGEGALKRLSGQIVTATAGFCSGSPSPTQYGPNAELYCTLATLPTSGDDVYLHVKASEIGASQAT